MHKRIITVAAVSALALAGVVIPAATASADPTSLLTVTLVAPNGSALGSSINATGSIGVSFVDADGNDDGDFYRAATTDPADYPDYTYSGALTNGAAAFNVPQDDDVYINTSGGPAYLSTYNSRHIGASAVSINVKTVHGGSISGHVTTPGSTSLPNTIVTAYNSEGGWGGQSTTDGAGNYTISELVTGKYKVQFNSRATGGSTAITNYGINYWKNKASWSTSTSFTINQQGKTTPYTAKTGINDAVVVGHSVSVTTNFTVPSSYGEANLVFIPVHDPDYVSTYLNSSGTAGFSKLAPDKYKVLIWNDSHFWYWTGNGKKVTSDVGKAKTLTFHGTSNVNILFN
jgi:hypothetical protein